MRNYKVIISYKTDDALFSTSYFFTCVNNQTNVLIRANGFSVFELYENKTVTELFEMYVDKEKQECEKVFGYDFEVRSPQGLEIN